MAKRRRRKNSILAGLAGLLIFLTGCGSYDATEDTLFVKKNGSVVETSVATLSASYYNEEELTSFVNEELSAYTGEGTVTLDDLTVEGKDASLTVSYSDGATYADFNKRTFFTGSVVQAQAAGFDFNVPFYAAESAEDTESAESGVPRETVIEDPNLYAVVLAQNCTVKLSGKLVYYSVNVFPTDKSTVVVTGYGEDGTVSEPAYIVYK